MGRRVTLSTVALLLKDRDGHSDVGPDPAGGRAPFTAPDFACETCAGAMRADQDWCLECGAAAPGRLGGKPGWRGAFIVVAAVLLLVSGATLAGYAALTTKSERTAAAASAGNGAPIAQSDAAPATPPPAVVQTGATGPGVTPPAVTTPPAVVAPPIIPTQPPAPPANTQVKPPATPPPAVATTPPPATSGTSTTGTTGTATGSTTAAAPKPEIVKFAKGAAATYDPNKRAGAEFGPAANAIDKSASTVWDVTVPADGKPIGAGLTVDLGKPYSLRALKISTPTAGFEVEIYAAVSAKPKDLPEDVLDRRWVHLTTIKSVVDGKIVSLTHKSTKQFQLLLLYVTQPGDLTDPRVAIGKVTVAGTPADATSP